MADRARVGTTEPRVDLRAVEGGANHHIWQEAFEANLAVPSDKYERPRRLRRWRRADALGSMQSTGEDKSVSSLLAIGDSYSLFDWLGYPRFDPDRQRQPPESRAVDVEPPVLEVCVGEYRLLEGETVFVKLEERRFYFSSGAIGRSCTPRAKDASPQQLKALG